MRIFFSFGCSLIKGTQHSTSARPQPAQRSQKRRRELSPIIIDPPASPPLRYVLNNIVLVLNMNPGLAINEKKSYCSETRYILFYIHQHELHIFSEMTF